jgi:predicted AlkP superfamily phosphohydrolase/phosphomutase
MLAFVLYFWPTIAFSYIGPGAGFAFLGSSLIFVVTLILALFTLLAWPFLAVLRKLKRKGLTFKARRVIIVGLDGLDAGLTEKLLSEGKLPNLRNLQTQGDYRRLQTTCPALSPVAWSSFQTGVNPGAHNIFDFLTRDKRHYVPTLASTETVAGKTIRVLGQLIPVGRPKVLITRKSKPFWKILGERGIFSNILRVPISYPPEKFGGNILAAMCTPDIRGTQGTFSFFTTRPLADEKVTGGERYQFIKGEAGELTGRLTGPVVTPDGKPLQASFTLTPINGEQARLLLGDTEIVIKLSAMSDWVSVQFRFGLRSRIHGIARFCLRECGEHVSLYVTPLHADPEKPALPIASPLFFSSWLAKRIGKFGTLGFAEDTWGRNELAITDAQFLEQAYLTHAEREAMFFEAMKKTREGVLACVFDASDRIQHMFWRYIDPAHPAPLEDNPEWKNVIPEMYQKMDAMVGRIAQHIQSNDVLIVLSDHGFGSFRRGINWNTWLMEQGYLVLKQGTDGSTDYLRDVDWSKTRAYCLGLTGVYLNRRGRELHGIVDASEADALMNEIIAKMLAMRDGPNACLRAVYQAEKIYRGVYTSEAPDLIFGYEMGYRVSWEAVTGALEPMVFNDNLKAWSGDHHIDPELVPGILFSNRKLRGDTAHIVDLAPTVLDLFGVQPPRYMEGVARM